MKFEEIIIAAEGNQFAVAPARGALVTALNVDGQDLLFLDRATFEDETKNVRGGIPLLFPFAGRLPEDKFLAAGTVIKQHGFARNKPWRVGAQSGSSISLQLESDEETMAVYPYPFLLEQRCTLLAHGLHVELRVSNTGSKKMPVAPGWHPYFPCPGPEKTGITSNVPKLDPGDFHNEIEFEVGVDHPPVEGAEFVIPSLGRLKLSYSSQMQHLHCWSTPGANFICLEPFTGDLNAINVDQRMEIKPGETVAFWMKIEMVVL